VAEDLPVKTGSPALAPSASATFHIQQNVSNDGCHVRPHTKNSVVNTNVAIENVIQLAEQRHQEVMYHLTSVAEENHRREVAQLAADATRAMHVQANDYANARDIIHREAI
jgi:hypothetical protein